MSTCYWVLLTAPDAQIAAPLAKPDPTDGVHWSRLLGSSGAPLAEGEIPGADATAADPPLRLWGVVSDEAGGGYALIGVGDAPPSGYAIGQTLEDGWVVGAVQERSVQLKRPHASGPALTLQLPVLDAGSASAVGVSP